MLAARCLPSRCALSTLLPPPSLRTPHMLPAHIMLLTLMCMLPHLHSMHHALLWRMCTIAIIALQANKCRL